MTIGRYLHNWLEGRKHALAPKTIECYERAIGQLDPLIGSRKVGKIKPKHVRAALAAIAADHPRSAQIAYAVLHAAKVPGMAKVAKPGHQTAPISYWTADQARAFLRSARGDRYYVAWVLGICCGLRRGEILGLRWSDVGADAIRIANQRIDVGGHILDTPPKTAKSRRTIPLVPAVRAVLEEQRRRQMHDALWAAGGYRASGYVLTQADGGPETPTSIQRAFRRALDRASQLPPITIHGMRHTCATVANAANTPIRDVQALLGHSSYQITADTYTHVPVQRVSAAIASVAGHVL